MSMPIFFLFKHINFIFGPDSNLEYLTIFSCLNKLEFSIYLRMINYKNLLYYQKLDFINLDY
jgi:hypothetical protein